MNAISIPNLAQKPDRTERIEFKEIFEDLPTLMPVAGVVTVEHRSNFLDVQATAQTIVTLPCDRCLQQYNQRLNLETREIIWLSDAPLDFNDLPLDEDLEDPEEMVECLSQDGVFEVKNWVYEQLCLELPGRKLCDPNCKGIEIANQDTGGDRRWKGLEALRGKLPDEVE
jgi:uncharacterized protein